MTKKNLHAILFPGKIDTSQRSLEEIIPEWIDSDHNLRLGGRDGHPTIRIAPTRIEPCSKLVFGVTKDGKYEFVGSTSSMDTYTDMADFIFVPPNPESHIYTQAISHQTTPTPYTFEPNPVQVTKGEQSVVYMRFGDNREAPTEPPSIQPIGEEESVMEHALKCLGELFQEKPVWRRLELERRLADDNIKISTWKLGKLIRQLGYYFIDGPWRSTYVRFGYDPRKDPEARRWQVLDFRQPSTGGPFGERGRSQLYQLSELEDPIVQALIERVPDVNEPHPQFGWMSQEDLHSIRNQLKLNSTDALRKVVHY